MFSASIIILVVYSNTDHYPAAKSVLLSDQAIKYDTLIKDAVF